MATKKKKNMRNISPGDSVQFVNFFSPDHILKGTYNTGNNELDISDIPQNLNSVITLGQSGPSVDVEELNVSANGIYTAPDGKAYSPVNVNVPATLTREQIFGPFTNNTAFAKVSDKGYSTGASARAAMVRPIPNNGYVITVTDPSKYAVAVYDITSDIWSYTGTSDSLFKEIFPVGSKSISWQSSDSASSDYIVIVLKKNDNTEFTYDELKNGAEAVFTYTSN